MAQLEAEEGNIPFYADKLLFAEDFVNYMMNNVFGIPYNANSADRYREFIYNAFTETVRQAVINLHSQVEMSMFRFLFGPDELNVWDGSTYTHLAMQIHNSRFTEGFEAKDFLFYCIELALLARKFREKGLQPAPDLAVYLIFVSVRGYNMLLGGWDSLNFIAANYVSVYDDCKRIPTPDTFASEISDEALRNANVLSQSSSSGSDNAAFQIAAVDAIPQQNNRGESGVPADNLEVAPIVNEDTCDEYLEFLYDDDEEEDSEDDDVQMAEEGDDRSSGVGENDKCAEVGGISSDQIHLEAEMQVDDAQASSGFYEGGNAFLSHVLFRHNYSDPGGTSQTEVNSESSGVGAKQESELHTVSLKSTLVTSKESEDFPVSLRLPVASVKDKPLQSSFEFKRVAEDDKNSTKSSTTTIHEVCLKDTSSIGEELNSKTCGSTKESDVQTTRTFENSGVSHTAERDCKSLTSEDGSKASTSHQSPWSFPSTSSSPSSPKFAEKALNSSNGLEMHQTDSEAVNNPQEPRGLKRFPIRDYESSHEKKRKLS